MLFLAGRFLGTLATGSQSVVIAWEVYEVARRTMSVAEAAFAVGMIGLAEFLPLFALTLIAGETADRHDRRRILALCYLAQVLISAALAFVSALGGGLWPIFSLAALFGCARAFFQPTASALGPMLVPLGLLPRAIATNSLATQLASILGPALGGLLCVVSPILGYAVSAGLYAAAACCAMLIRADTRPPFEAHRSRVAQIREGLVYIGENKLVLGAISLDLFAVLLGGATGLLPVFARDVLEVGPQGFGILRASPAVGALMVAMYLAHRPIRAAGVKMLLAVSLFGLMTVVFAYSRSLPYRCSPWRCLAGRTWCRCLPGKAWCRSLRRTGCGAAYRRLRLCSSVRRMNLGSSKAASRPDCLGLSGRWRSVALGRWW